MWIKEAITDGEIDALRQAAIRAWSHDTGYPNRTSSHSGSTGQCYVTARWLVDRLGGFVGSRLGHFSWLSPDQSFTLDLTGNHSGQVIYAANDGYVPFPTVDNERTERFTKRANLLFDNLGALMKTGMDYAGDAMPAQEPQATSDRDQFDSYWHDEPAAEKPSGIYQFVYANGQLEVSPNHDHDELAGHAGITPDAHTGPFVAGTVSVSMGTATFEAHSNVNLYSLQKVLKDYCKQVGWQWGGLTDAGGQPINDDFGPAKTTKVINYAYDGDTDHLWLGRSSHGELTLRSLGASGHGDGGAQLRTGALHIRGSRVEVHPVHVDSLPSLFEWATDSGLKLYAANDNVIKRIPDLQEENIYAPPGPIEPRPQELRQDEREPSGLYKCPACNQLFPRWGLYQKHRREEESWGDPQQEDGGFPPIPSEDDIDQLGQTRQEPGITTGSVVMPVTSWKEASRVDGFMRYAKVWHYDNDDFTHYVAYRNGSPVGSATVKGDEILMVQSAVENQGIGTSLLWKVMQHNDRLFTHAAHERTAHILAKNGWVCAAGQKWKWSKDDQGKDMIEAPLPFIYDVDGDKIIIGHPGTRTAEIPGQFTPGGIVEGSYEPGGKVVIKSLTSTPYTVRHMVELWYYQQPHLEVTSVHLQDDQGKDTRLATRYTKGVDVLTTLQTALASSPAAFNVVSSLEPHGGRVFIVGGAVRDAIMGRDPHDLDLMVTGMPAEEVQRVLANLQGRVDYTGKDFGVFRYKYHGEEVEVALPRRERSTGVSHQAFEIQADHTMTPEEDLARRDYTVNAIAYDIADRKLVDPFGGYGDIEQNVLRTITESSLSDDPLRIMRGLVAHARFGFEPDEKTRYAMTANADGLGHLPAERIQTELDKLFEADDPAAGIELAHSTGTLGRFFPEIEDVWDWSQNNPHHELALGQHCVAVLRRIATVTTDRDLRLAALLHDIGKKDSMWVDPETGSFHFYASKQEDGSFIGADHEVLGAAYARARLNALKGYSKERISRIVALVENHMFGAFTTKKGARKFMSAVNEHADDLMLLRWADNGGKQEYGINNEFSTDKQSSLIEQVRNEGEATDKRMLVVNGHDLIEAGIQPSPRMGKIFDHLLEQVLENPEMNTRDYLLTAAQNYERLNA